METEFSAPWGKSLIAMTLSVSLLLLGLPLIMIFKIEKVQLMAALPTLLLPAAIFVGTMLYTIRGYILSPNKLLVRRLLWNTKVSLADLEKVEIDPAAMSKSIRTWGNGGLFSFSGHFKNKKLGKYRAFVTDMKNSVILTFPERQIVVSPDHPQQFLDTLKTLKAIE